MLLDREPSLASLGEYATEAQRGEGRVVLVSGEAGVGKSALLEEFERRLHDARWLWSGCDGLITPRPLGPVFDLAGRLGGEVPDMLREDASRDDLFAAVRRQLDTFTVLAIEDMHWADEATIDLVRYLGRRIRDSRTLLVLTYRDDGLPLHHPLRVALGQLAGLRTTRRIGLAPLSSIAVSTLAEGSGIDPTELFRLTSGNPFYVTEVIASGTRTVPASARDAVLARVAALDAAARDTLEVAALMGTRLEVQELATVCGGQAVDDLVTAGLLGAGPVLRFRHEIARLAVEQSIAPHRRCSIHSSIYAGLKALGCRDEARLAHHAEAAGHPDVIELAQRAAHRAAGLASHCEAAAQYERALRHADGLDAETRACLLDDMCTELAHLDRLDDAAKAGEQALTLWRSTGNRLRQGDLRRRLSQISWNLCRGEEAADLIESAIAILQPLGSTVELARALATSANQRLQYGDTESATDLARRAQTVAESHNALDVVSDSLNTQAVGLADGEEAAATMLQALDLALAGGHREQAARAHANLCGILVAHRRFADAEKRISDALSYCDEYEFTCYATFVRNESATLHERAGRWTESTALTNDILHQAGLSPANRLYAIRRLAAIAARRGAPGVWEHLDEAAVAASASGEPQHLVPVGLARAEARWLSGNADAARQEVESLTAFARRCDPWDRGALAVWLRRVGSDRTIAGHLAEPYRLALVGRTEHAARLWLDLGCPYDAATTFLDGGSESGLRKALGIFMSLDSVPAARMARRRMRQLGMTGIPAGARPATRANPLNLTQREREVLNLVHAGHTNSAIAGVLMISVKTAGHHVSAILAKLGAPTRGAAASEAVRRGLLAAE